jgi:hypothetical protein
VVTDTGEQSHPRAARRLNEPQAALVVATRGRPTKVGRATVAAVREEWRIVDRWWTEEPVRRRYFEVVVATGENVVVFHDEERGAWFTQRGA